MIPDDVLLLSFTSYHLSSGSRTYRACFIILPSGEPLRGPAMMSCTAGHQSLTCSASSSMGDRAIQLSDDFEDSSGSLMNPMMAARAVRDSSLPMGRIKMCLLGPRKLTVLCDNCAVSGERSL